MWFISIEDWQKDKRHEKTLITDWEMDIKLVEGDSSGDGIRKPTKDQIWAFFGYKVTKVNRRKEFVAMIPHFIFPNNPQNKRVIQDDFKVLKKLTKTTDALDLVALSKVAHDNGLLHEVDLVTPSAPLKKNIYQI
jgi:hypothetical protein